MAVEVSIRFGLAKKEVMRRFLVSSVCGGNITLFSARTRGNPLQYVNDVSIFFIHVVHRVIVIMGVHRNPEQP
jgi:hypothetical protein